MGIRLRLTLVSLNIEICQILYYMYFFLYIGGVVNSYSMRRVLLVLWKGKKERPVEVFSSLKNFCQIYPSFNYHTITNYLSKEKTPYETDKVKIERQPVQTKRGDISTPNLARRLFWDFRYNDIEWQNDYGTIIERVIERGTDEEWGELMRFYGRQKVIDTLKFESTYLPEHAINRVCEYFKIQPKDLRCYTRKRLRQGHWI